MLKAALDMMILRTPIGPDVLELKQGPALFVASQAWRPQVGPFLLRSKREQSQGKIFT